MPVTALYAQLLVNTMVSASIWVLVGLGFSLIFSTVRFFYFAHAAAFTAGAYFTFVFVGWIGLPVYLAVILAIISASLLGCTIELVVHRPLRSRDATPVSQLLASLGIYFVLQNTISLAFGEEARRIVISFDPNTVLILGAHATSVQFCLILVSLTLTVVLSLLFKFTTAGTIIRATANDDQLAYVCGIDERKVILLVFGLGSCLAAVAGFFQGMMTDITPAMGIMPFMMGIVAAIVGGISGLPGVALGALLLSVAQNFGGWLVGTQWQDAIAFLVLILFLLLRPQG